MPLIHKSEFCCGFLSCGDVEVGGCYEDALAIFRDGSRIRVLVLQGNNCKVSTSTSY